jgi:beta-glucosidase
MQLRGFRRVALEPGQAKRVSFQLTAAQFALWTDGWTTEPGAITLMVGAASDDIRGNAEITLTEAGRFTTPAPAIATPTREEIVR